MFNECGGTNLQAMNHRQIAYVHLKSVAIAQCHSSFGEVKGQVVVFSRLYPFVSLIEPLIDLVSAARSKPKERLIRKLRIFQLLYYSNPG